MILLRNGRAVAGSPINGDTCLSTGIGLGWHVLRYKYKFLPLLKLAK